MVVGGKAASFSVMSHADGRRRWSSGLLSLLFAFFLSEAMVTGCCDEDLAQASVVGAALTSEQPPADGESLPASAHVCQCAHTTSVFRTAPPRTAFMLDHRVPTYTVTPPPPPSRTLQPDLRPPIS